MTLSAHTIPAVILAGGEGVRLGRGTKALVSLAGRALIEHVRDRLTPQTARVGLSLRTDEAWAAQLNLPLILDAAPNAGPLAGVAAALAWAQPSSFVLTCPTDSPLIPADLCARLTDQMNDETDIVVATSGDRRHHVTALWRTSIRIPLDKPMPVHVLHRRLRVKTVTWPTLPFDPFHNINTAADLTLAERIWSSGAGQRATA